MRRRRGSGGGTMACGNEDCEGAPLEAMFNTDRLCDVCSEAGNTVLSCRKCDFFDVCEKCANGGDTEQDEEEGSQSTSAAGEEGDGATETMWRTVGPSTFRHRTGEHSSFLPER